MNSDEVKKSKINASLNHVLNSSAVRNINNVSPKIGLVQRIKKNLQFLHLFMLSVYIGNNLSHSFGTIC